MAYPKIRYKPSSTVASTAVTSNVVTVIVTNTFAVGDAVQLDDLTVHTELNNQVLTVLSASGSQFTAAWTHTNYSTAAEAGGKAYHVLQFTYPPVNKPGADEKNAVRHDSITIDGHVQAITERVEVFKNLQMDFVPMSDLPLWDAFTDWSVLGNSFSYYPDSSSATHTDYTLEDSKWMPNFAFKNVAKFSMRMRKLVP